VTKPLAPPGEWIVSVGASSVTTMTQRALPALTLTALELLPAEPSDLSAILLEPGQRDALTAMRPDASSWDLTAYLCAQLDPWRVEQWDKRLELLYADYQARAVLVHESPYPPSLRRCWDAPPLLFVRGTSPPAARALAIVGSRTAAQPVLDQTREVARLAAATGSTVVSGLAAGVDTAAHLGTLDAGGITIAVMGTGIQSVYPPQNRPLAERVLESGALVSQFAPDAPRTPTSFLRRNSVIAGLAAASLVMSGEERSGSRHQAEQAARYGRPVLLWQPELGQQPWALAMVQAQTARWVNTAEAVMAALPIGE
jgi:DNA processing protein